MLLRIRNGIEKARMILDTKESGIKRITAKTQRVILPKLMNAIMLLLTMLSLCQQAGIEISAFVFDFFNTFWQISIRHDEQRFFRAQITIKGKAQVSGIHKGGTGECQRTSLVVTSYITGDAANTGTLPLQRSSPDVLRR